MKNARAKCRGGLELDIKRDQLPPKYSYAISPFLSKPLLFIISQPAQLFSIQIFRKVLIMAMEKNLQQATKTSRFSRICVFCGSSPGKKPIYQLAAVQLGKELVIFNPFFWLKTPILCYTRNRCFMPF